MTGNELNRFRRQLGMTQIELAKSITDHQIMNNMNNIDDLMVDDWEADHIAIPDDVASHVLWLMSFYASKKRLNNWKREYQPLEPKCETARDKNPGDVIYVREGSEFKLYSLQETDKQHNACMGCDYFARCEPFTRSCVNYNYNFHLKSVVANVQTSKRNIRMLGLVNDSINTLMYHGISEEDALNRVMRVVQTLRELKVELEESIKEMKIHT